ncbi:PRONE domain, partial [Dillenia turbinata]
FYTWHREMEWLLSVSKDIVELIPSSQQFPGGGTFEVMVTRPRSDLHVNLPALKKIDAMLLSLLDGFHDSEFCYVDSGIIVMGPDDFELDSVSSSSERPSVRQEEKWWLPLPKVPPNGLSVDMRKRLLQSKESTNQILKATMEIPDVDLEGLPKVFVLLLEIHAICAFALFESGKACLGEIIYHNITSDQFSPERLLDYLDLSSEFIALEIANRIEAAVHIWRKKSQQMSLNYIKSGRSSLTGKVKGFGGAKGKTELLAQRAESLLQNLMLRFPGLPQTALDMNKIQYNKDVGHSILESYSRVMESVALSIKARIEVLLYVDDATKQHAAEQSACLLIQRSLNGSSPLQKQFSPSSISTKSTPCPSSFATPAYCPSPLMTGNLGRAQTPCRLQRSF